MMEVTSKALLKVKIVINLACINNYNEELTLDTKTDHYK